MAFLVLTIEILIARPFTLDEPAVHEWRAERPPYASGVVLVLQVDDPELLRPRQVAEPVLYVGDQTAEKVVTDVERGVVVVIVPGAFDPATTPVWFGEPGLPEAVDAEEIARQRAAADPPLAVVTGPVLAPVSFADVEELHAYAEMLATASTRR